MGRNRKRLTEEEHEFLQKIGIEAKNVAEKENEIEVANRIYDTVQFNKKLIDEVVISTKAIIFNKRDKTEDYKISIDLME